MSINILLVGRLEKHIQRLDAVIEDVGNVHDGEHRRAAGQTGLPLQAADTMVTAGRGDGVKGKFERQTVRPILSLSFPSPRVSAMLA